MDAPRSAATRTIIADYLRERFPAFSGKAIEDDLQLVDTGAIDSLGILDLMTFLGEQLGIEISDDDFEPSNFETFGHLVRFVERKQA